MYVDWIAGAMTAVGIYCYQRRWQLAGHYIGLLAQIPWILLALKTGAWGILPLEALLVVMYSWALLRWPR